MKTNTYASKIRIWSLIFFITFLAGATACFVAACYYANNPNTIIFTALFCTSIGVVFFSIFTYFLLRGYANIVAAAEDYLLSKNAAKEQALYETLMTKEQMKASANAKASVHQEEKSKETPHEPLYKEEKPQITQDSSQKTPTPPASSSVFSLSGITYCKVNNSCTVTGFVSDKVDKKKGIIIPAAAGDCPVISIRAEAFANATITKITIPSSINAIGRGAFSNCAFLTSILYLGTMQEWLSIYLFQDWNQNCPVAVVHCSDGDVHLEP